MKKQNKTIALVLFLSGIIALILIGFLFKEKSTLFFPESSYPLFTRCDKEESGNSEVDLQKTDSLLSVPFRLRSGAVSPYAGISFYLNPPGALLRKNFFDFSEYDSLKIRAKTERMPKLTIRFSVFDPLYTNLENPISVRPVEKVIEVERQFKTITIPVSDFRVPLKWFSLMGIENPDAFSYLNQGMRLEVLTAHGAMLGISDAFDISHLELKGKNYTLFKILGCIAIFWTLLFILFLFTSKKELSAQEISQIEKAKRLLETSNYSAAEIAIKVGFKNTKTYQKIFKQVVKISETEWRKSHGK